MTDISPHKTYDFIIIGQGLAGSLLSYELFKFTNNILVIDDHYKSASSKMAAGLMNPITGLRLVKTSNIEVLLPAAKALYRALENMFDSPLLYETDMIRLLLDEHEYQQFNKRKQEPEYNSWLGDFHKPSTLKHLNDALGSFDQLQTAWLDIPKLLDNMHHWIHEQNNLIKTFAQLNLSDIDIKIDHTDHAQVSLHTSIQGESQTIKTRNLIFCRGYKEKDGHYFNWLPFQVAKGEILTLRSNKPLPSIVINFKQWVIPIDPFTIKTGASWNRETLDQEISSIARTQLMDKIKTLYNIPGLEFKVINQQAGVRPCTKQRQPLIGTHPAIEALKIFNGFGSKGSLLIPYYAKEFARLLCKPSAVQNSLLKSSDIKQFWHE